jgi:hypothetical protein
MKNYILQLRIYTGDFPNVKFHQGIYLISTKNEKEILDVDYLCFNPFRTEDFSMEVEKEFSLETLIKGLQIYMDANIVPLAKNKSFSLFNDTQNIFNYVDATNSSSLSLEKIDKHIDNFYSIEEVFSSYNKSNTLDVIFIHNDEDKE